MGDKQEYQFANLIIEADKIPIDLLEYFEPIENSKGSVFDVTPKPFSEAHFAVFPQELVLPMIKAGCPEFICNKCGKAREKIYKIDYKKHRPSGGKKSRIERGNKVHDGGYGNWGTFGTNLIKQTKEIGLTDCGCNAGFHPGVVFDPFIGSGTTGIVANKLNRNYVGIELKEEYLKMAEKRMDKELGFFKGVTK